MKFLRLKSLKMNITDGTYFLNSIGEASLFQREEDIFTMEKIEKSFYIVNSKGDRLAIDPGNNYSLNFLPNEDDEIEFAEFSLKRGKIQGLFYDKIDGFCLNFEMKSSFYFTPYVKSLPFSQDFCRTRDNFYEKYYIPKDIHVKNFVYQNQDNSRDENLFYNHIIANRYEHLIPKIYKLSEREIIMESYFDSLDNVKIIDDHSYRFSDGEKLYTFDENIKDYLIESLSKIDKELIALGIYHSDYHLGNFLVSEDLKEIKVIDFESMFINNEKELLVNHFTDDDNIEEMTLEDYFNDVKVNFTRYFH